MSKTMKIKDFIERINNLDFKIGTKIKFQDKIYLYDYPNLVGIYEIGKPPKREYSIFAQLDITNLHSTVEIIEEQEEIDIQSIEKCDINITQSELVHNLIDIQDYINNVILNVVKQLDKIIKEKQ